jgi:hypothetical protein
VVCEYERQRGRGRGREGETERETGGRGWEGGRERQREREREEERLLMAKVCKAPCLPIKDTFLSIFVLSLPRMKMFVEVMVFDFRKIHPCI